MPTVLFVCTANACRSPMAAALFAAEVAKRAPEAERQAWIVRSAGTWAGEGLPASTFAVEALLARGSDLAAHRSRSLRERDVMEADLILVMESHHREAILAEWPAAKDRVFRLSEMAG